MKCVKQQDKQQEITFVSDISPDKIYLMWQGNREHRDVFKLCHMQIGTMYHIAWHFLFRTTGSVDFPSTFTNIQEAINWALDEGFTVIELSDVQDFKKWLVSL